MQFEPDTSQSAASDANHHITAVGYYYYYHCLIYMLLSVSSTRTTLTPILPLPPIIRQPTPTDIIDLDHAIATTTGGNRAAVLCGPVVGFVLRIVSSCRQSSGAWFIAVRHCDGGI